MRINRAFALPTVVIVSVVMLMVLSSSVAITVAFKASNTSRSYNQLARQATESGVSYANSCLDKNDGLADWSEDSPLMPSTDCDGIVLDGVSCPDNSLCYVVSNEDYRSTFEVSVAEKDVNLRVVRYNVVGTVELLRDSDGGVWRTYNYNQTESLNTPTVIDSNMIVNLDAAYIESYPGSGTTWLDLSGNGLSGTLMGGVTYNSANKSLVFNGSDGYVKLPRFNWYSDQGLTVSAWIKTDRITDAWERIFGFGNGAGINTITLARRGTGGTNYCIVWYKYDDGVAQTLNVYGVFNYGEWINFVGTIDANGQMYVYRDGMLVGGLSGATAIGDIDRANNYIGKSNWGGSDPYFDGEIGVAQVYNRALSASEIKSNYDVLRHRYGLTENGLIEDGLVVNLDANYTGSGKWENLVDNDLDAEFSGGATHSISNHSFSFDGSDDYAYLPANNWYSEDGFTVSAWVKNDDFSGSWERIIDFGNGAPLDNIAFARNGTGVGTIRWYTYNGTAQSYVEVTNTIVAGEWSYLTGSVDGSGHMKLYKDGVLIGENASGYNVANTALNNCYIGKSNWSSNPNWDGEIGALNIYNRALSDSEVLNNYAALKSQYLGPDL